MRKVFVDVISHVDTNGKVTPLEITWDDGRRYEIDKVIEVKKAASLSVGGQGILYRVKIMGKETNLFFEDGRWFMEGKDNARKGQR